MYVYGLVYVHGLCVYGLCVLYVCLWKCELSTQALTILQCVDFSMQSNVPNGSDEQNDLEQYTLIIKVMWFHFSEKTMVHKLWIKNKQNK